MTFASNWKPSRTARKLKERKKRLKRQTDEIKEKRIVRKRDKYRCRFPLCGCQKLGIRLEVSHDRHKGHYGAEGSVAPLMVLLCFTRHQDGIVSRHHGTLRARYLTPKNYDGPVAWDIAASTVGGKGDKWIEVARESAVQVLEPLTPQQRQLLEELAEMHL